jgi:hypothetical protein
MTSERCEGAANGPLHALCIPCPVQETKHKQATVKLIGKPSTNGTRGERKNCGAKEKHVKKSTTGAIE